MKALIIDRVSPLIEIGLKKYGFDVETEILPTREKLQNMLPGYDLLIMRVDPRMDKDLLDAARGHIKMIGVCAAGLNHIDLDYAKKCGIFVQNAPGINYNAVAELTIAKMIDLSRMCIQANNEVQNEGIWNKYKYTGHELSGHRLGIIGLGHIGKRVAVLAKAFDMDVSAYDPYICESEFHKIGVKKESELKKIFETCDYISIHTPMNSETKGMVSKELIEIMKPNAVLINCARGRIVDEDAVANKKKKHKINGYGSDVLTNELKGNVLLDKAKLTSSLIGVEGFIVTPHIGGSTREAYDHIGQFIVNSVASFFGLG